MTYWIRMWIITTNRKGFVSKIVANGEDEIHGDGLSYVPDGACFVPILGPQSIGSPGVRLVK